MKRPVGIILSVIVLGCFAAGQLLFTALMAFSAVFGSRAYGSGGSLAPPPKIILYFGLFAALLFAAMATWSIFTIIGLVRLRNWARISILIIGGCLVFLGGSSALFAIAAIFLSPTPNAQSPLTSHTQHLVLAITGIFYGLLAAVGVWWLVYFNLRRVRALFAPPISRLPDCTLDPAGYRAFSAPPSRFAQVPTTITILACLFFVSALTCGLMAFAPLPAFLLGFIITGSGQHILYAVLAILSGLIGYGLIHLDNRARIATIALLCLGILNVPLMMLPWYQSQFRIYNQQIVDKFQLPGLPATAPPALTSAYFIFIGVIGLVIYGGIFWLIQRHRASFLKSSPPSLPLL
ncbi:MAG: hypothetical protein JWM43_2910 [Acidobacteriaceae bacterium]|nr:hypothetical protein [Acidobacteriaceae bacterium]